MEKSFKKYKNLPKGIESNIIKESAIMYQSDLKLDALTMINTSRKGLSMHTILKIGQQLALSLQEISKVLHLSIRTLQRYASSKVLDADSSAKALQLVKLQQHGIIVFGDSVAFSKWLHSSIPALGGDMPLDYLDTPFGFELVDQVLGRIEYGIFS